MHQLVALRQHGEGLLHPLAARRIRHSPCAQLQDRQLPLSIPQQRLQAILPLAAPDLLDALLLHQGSVPQLSHLLQPVEILLQQPVYRRGGGAPLQGVEGVESRHHHGLGILHLAAGKLSHLAGRGHQASAQGITLRHQGQALPHQPALLPQVAYDGLAQGMELLLHLLLPLTAELSQQALHLLPLQGEQAPLMLPLRLAGRRGQQMGGALDLAAQARQGTGPLLIGQGLLHPLLQLAQVGEPNPPEQGGAQGQQRHQGEGQQQPASQAGKDSHAQHLGCGRL